MEAPGGWVWQTQQPWVVSRLAEDTKFPDLSSWLSDRGVQSLCVVPATTALRKLGALAFGSSHEAAYTEADVVFLQQVARQVAVAMDNAHNFAEAQSVHKQLEEERDRLSLLLEVNNTVVSVLDLHELLKAVSDSLAPPGAARICQPLALRRGVSNLANSCVRFSGEQGTAPGGSLHPRRRLADRTRDTNPPAGFHHAQRHRAVRFGHRPAHTRRGSQVGLLPAADFP